MWTGCAVETALLGVQREDPLRRAQPPHPVLGGGDAEVGELVSNEPVPVSRGVGVDVEGGVEQVGVVVVALGDGVLEPLAVPPGWTDPGPCTPSDRHPDRGTGRGHLTDEREDYFPGRFACDR